MSVTSARDNVSVFASTGLRASRRRSRRGVACGLVEKLESTFGQVLKPGRNVWYGYPVDIDDQSPEGGLAVDAVDRDAASGLLKELRRRGFKVQRNTNTQLLIQASTTRRRSRRGVACGPTWLPAELVKRAEHVAEVSAYCDDMSKRVMDLNLGLELGQVSRALRAAAAKLRKIAQTH